MVLPEVDVHQGEDILDCVLFRHINWNFVLCSVASKYTINCFICSFSNYKFVLDGYVPHSRWFHWVELFHQNVYKIRFKYVACIENVYLSYLYIMSDHWLHILEFRKIHKYLIHTWCIGYVYS